MFKNCIKEHKIENNRKKEQLRELIKKEDAEFKEY
jgi:hypothetical protein